MTEFRDGGSSTTEIGYQNRHKKKCLGHRGKPGNHFNQRAYKMKCLCCGHTYGANGADIHLRKCPNCQCGASGIEY